MDKYQNKVKDLPDDRLIALAEGYGRIVKFAWVICGLPCAFIVLGALINSIALENSPPDIVAFFVGGGLLLFALFAWPIIDYKKTGEAAVAEVHRRGIEHKITKLKSENRETRKYIFLSIVSILGIIAIFIFIGAITSSDNHKSDKGYWGSNGYYHPSDEEMEDVWDDVYDWMDKNWD